MLNLFIFDNLCIYKFDKFFKDVFVTVYRSISHKSYFHLLYVKHD